MTQTPFIKFAPDLYLIPLPQALPGFEAFINAWLVAGERIYLVDPGPAATINVLVSALQGLGIRHLDAIFLTHIHIDHSGGIGDLLKWFPDTPVVCHCRAVDHLVEPQRLWEGSLKTLGETARAYGPIAPVPREGVIPVESFAEAGIRIIPTPGHAVHHVSYLVNRTLFAGEAGGVFQKLPDGEYLRPATPPRFFLETSLASIRELERIDCDRMCYGHYGLTRAPARLLAAHRRQLQWWAVQIETLAAGAGDRDPVKHCLDALIRKDPLLTGWTTLTPENRQRELAFMSNSVRGFLGYLEQLNT